MHRLIHSILLSILLGTIGFCELSVENIATAGQESPLPDDLEKSKSKSNKERIDGEKLLDPQHLIDIRIEIPEADWKTLKSQFPNGEVFSGGDSTESNYTYFRGTIWIDGQRIDSVGIRKKGFFGSNDMDRPSLKISFDEYEKQDPIKGIDRLTLNNNKQDRSLLSQYLAYSLFVKAGVHAPRSNFAKVTVNDQYLGIYSNVESIKKPFLKKQFEDSSGALYEGALTDFHPLSLQNIEAKNTSAQQRDKLQKLTAILNADGDLDLPELEKLIDLDNFLRYWAVECLIGFWDGYAANQNNYYVYFSPKNDRAYFIPWGADFAFTANGPFAGFGPPTSVIYAQSILANRLYHVPSVQQRFHKTLEEVVEQIWLEDELIQHVDQMEKLLSPHLGDSQSGVPRSMKQLKHFIATRKKTVLEQLANGAVNVPDSPRMPAHRVPVGALKGSFATQWGPADKDNQSSEIQLHVSLNGEEISFDGLTVSIKNFTPPLFGFGGPGFGGPGFGGKPVQEAVLLVTGTKAESPTMMFSFNVPVEDLKVDQDIKLNGRLIEIAARTDGVGLGNGGFGGFGGGFGPGVPNRLLQGNLKLSSFESKDGAPVTGTLEIEIIESRGGMFGGPPPGGRRPGFGGSGGQGFGAPGFGAPGQALAPGKSTDKSQDGTRAQGAEKDGKNQPPNDDDNK